MKALLTGITGNLGCELAYDLLDRGFDVVPIIRPEKIQEVRGFSDDVKEFVLNNLTGDDPIEFTGAVDFIVHCAGVVHFRNAGNANEKMMVKIVDLARKLQRPIYFISTAFVYRSPGNSSEGLHNDYERDKDRAEQILIQSGVPYTIFRPSILVGSNKTGEIKNFSGYYLVIEAFVSASKSLATDGPKIRFPKLPGRADMITVDQAAKSIGQYMSKADGEILFVTNPKSPSADDVLCQSLEILGVGHYFEFLECSFEEFGKLNLTNTERKLYQFGQHFNPYWSLAYDFPNTICLDNLIDREYLEKAIKYFCRSKNISNE